MQFYVQEGVRLIGRLAARMDSDPRLLKRLCVLLFVWACIVRLALFCAVDHSVAAGVKMGEMYNVARTIAERGEFSDPYREKALTGPTAHVAPVFAYFLAAQIRLAPNETFFRYANSLLAALAISVLWGCLPWLSVQFGLGGISGLAAGLYGASNPLHHWLDFEGVWDQNYTALGLALLLVFCFKRLRPDKQVRHAVLAGVLWGLLMLTQPATLMALFALCLFVLVRHRGAGRAMLVRLLVVLLLAAAVVTPWTIRNRITLGGWVPFVRDDLPLTLAVAFNDHAEPHMMNNLFRPGVIVRHPHLNAEEAKLVATMGEYKYMQLRRPEAPRWMRTHPKRTLELIAGRFLLFWIPQRKGWIRLVEVVLTCSALLGLYWARKYSRAALLVGFLWLFFPVMYYLANADERYRSPIDWSIALMAGYCWTSLAQKLARRRSVASSQAGVSSDGGARHKSDVPG